MINANTARRISEETSKFVCYECLEVWKIIKKSAEMGMSNCDLYIPSGMEESYEILMKECGFDIEVKDKKEPKKTKISVFW